MKVQQTILKTYKNGKVTDFERFTRKTAQGVLNEYKKAFAPYQFEGFFFKEYKEADKIVIYATPDGCREEKELSTYTPEQFFELIKR